jgi:hypothetical protein
MQIDAIASAGTESILSAPLPALIDPLDHDEPHDEMMVTTRRGLIRLALVAADTGSRFEREGIGHDPVAWMMTPRALFEGRSAIDACLEREECLRAVLLHGLSIGLDADPMTLDALMAADDDEEEDFDGLETAYDGDHGIDMDTMRRMQKDGERPRLWTSFLVDDREGGTIQAFDAVVAGDRFEAETRLRARHGPAIADAIEISEGFDPNTPLAEALVSPAVADMLEQVAANPGSLLAKGLSVHIEQRFAA